jgi:hypothetical protein
MFKLKFIIFLLFTSSLFAYSEAYFNTMQEFEDDFEDKFESFEKRKQNEYETYGNFEKEKNLIENIKTRGLKNSRAGNIGKYDWEFKKRTRSIEIIFYKKRTFSSGIHIETGEDISFKREIKSFLEHVKLKANSSNNPTVKYVFLGSSDNGRKDGVNKKIVQYSGKYGNISRSAKFRAGQKRFSIKKNSYISNLELAMVRAYSLYKMLTEFDFLKGSPLDLRKAEIEFKVNIEKSINKDFRSSTLFISVDF